MINPIDILRRYGLLAPAPQHPLDKLWARRLRRAAWIAYRHGGEVEEIFEVLTMLGDDYTAAAGAVRLAAKLGKKPTTFVKFIYASEVCKCGSSVMRRSVSPPQRRERTQVKITEGGIDVHLTEVFDDGGSLDVWNVDVYGSYGADVVTESRRYLGSYNWHVASATMTPRMPPNFGDEWSERVAGKLRAALLKS